MYKFDSLSDVLETFKERGKEARRQQEKYRALAKEYSALDSSDHSTLAANIRRDVKFMGGIESTRRMRSEQGGNAVAWETAANMLSDFLQAQRPWGPKFEEES